jgi:hypothetical protein
MKVLRLCLLSSVPLLLSAALITPTRLVAQDEMHDSTKVLVINREFTKPGRDGSTHEATEAAYIRAVLANKGTFHYIALNSVTGTSRALFVSAYPSLEAVEAERKSMSAALNTALDKANVADGEQLNETDSSIWLRRDDLSTNVSGPPAGMRLLEVSEFVVKPGREHEFNELAKMYVETAKGIPEMHWTAYELAYGHADGPTFLVFTALKSASEADAEFAAGKRFDDALGADGRKKMADLEAACVSTEMTNLFVVNPKMSIPTDAMVAAEPAFWRPKATSSTATKKPAAKSSTTAGQ